MISVLGLILIAIVTISLLNGQIPIIGSKGNGNGNGNGIGNGSNATPAPSNVVIVDPGVTFKGTIVYAKAALDHYNKAIGKLKAGDWAGFGAELDAMKPLLEDLNKAKPGK